MMSISTNAKQITKIYHGSNKVFTDNSMEWLPCTVYRLDGKSSSNASGIILMHDSGDGSAYLVGGADLGSVEANAYDSKKILEAPKGYKFSGAISNALVVATSNIRNWDLSIKNGAIYATASSYASPTDYGLLLGIKSSEGTSVDSISPSKLKIEKV